jgi:hypothetical protein
MNDKQQLEFETRYYLAEAKRLQREAMQMLHESDDMLEHAVLTWNRAKEVVAG